MDELLGRWFFLFFFCYFWNTGILGANQKRLGGGLMLEEGEEDFCLHWFFGRLLFSAERYPCQ